MVVDSVVTHLFAALRLPLRAYEALGRPQPSLRARVV
jgi:hypothetical protein